MTNRLILVTGAPCSGKTTLARPFARTLKRTLVEKDLIKEVLYDALDLHGPGWSRQLSDTAFEVMFRLGDQPSGLVMEGNFKHAHGDRLRALDPELIELFCRCSDAEMLRRNGARRRHVSHPNISDEELLKMARHGPLSLGGPLLEVDTSVRGYAAAAVRWTCDQL